MKMTMLQALQVKLSRMNRAGRRRCLRENKKLWETAQKLELAPVKASVIPESAAVVIPVTAEVQPVDTDVPTENVP